MIAMTGKYRGDHSPSFQSFPSQFTAPPFWIPASAGMTWGAGDHSHHSKIIPIMVQNPLAILFSRSSKVTDDH